MKRLLLFGVATVAVALCALAPVPTRAAINPQISFQGKLTNPDGTNVTDGNFSIRFRLYTDPTADTGSCASTCKWEETQGTVTVNGGLFTVNLGSVTALPGSVDFNNATLYLGVKVSSDAEMTPRVRLTAVPQAFNSDTLDGLDASAFVQLSGGNINLGAGTVTSGAVNGIAIGSTIQPSTAGALTLSSNGSSALTLTSGAATTWSTTAGLLTVQGAGGVTITTPDVSGASATVTIQGGDSSAGTAGNVTIDTGTTSTGTPTVNLGNTNAKAVQVGNNTSNPTITIDSGTGTIGIGTGAQARAINIGTGGAAQTIVVGSGTGASSVDIVCGTGVCRLGQNAVARTITIGNTTGTSAVTIDSGTGTIGIGTGAQARAVNLGTGGAAQTVTVGSTNGASTLDLQAGTGGIDITTQGTGAINIGNNAVAQSINIGNGTGATTVAVLCGTGACGFGNNAVAHTTTLGSNTGAANTILQAGTAGLSLTSGGNITLGTSDTTGTLLVLDTKTNAGDPTGTNGGMYYNSSTNTFRCFQGGAWKNCDSDFTTVKLTSDQSRTATSYANVTGLTFSVAANTDYDIECTLLYDTAAVGTGAQFAVNGPASPTALTSTYQVSTSTTADTVYSHTAYNNTTNLPTASQGTVRTVGKLWAVLRNGANAGTFAVRYRSEVNASAVNVRIGSYCKYRIF